MDTKFWGPSGWKFLHLVAYTYPNNPTSAYKVNYKNFYLSLDKILPCKYCRNSLSKFYKQLPIIEYLDNKELLTEWIYLIHNKVNNKLRKQKLLNKPNPQKKDIENIYKKILKENRCNYSYLGWEFFYSITFNFPKIIKNVSNKNKIDYILFFKNLENIIVCPKFKKCYIEYIKSNPIEENVKHRGQLTKWLYELNCKMNKYNLFDNYYNLCKKYKKIMVSECKNACSVKKNIKNNKKKI